MNDKEELVFFGTGILFMVLITAINYLVGHNSGFVNLMVTFLFGGAVGLLAISPKDNYWKNMVFIIAFTWIIWAFLNPVSVVGNTWVIKSTELLSIITVFIIFSEREFINIFKRLSHKKTSFGIGLFGITALSILLTMTNFFSPIVQWLGQHTAVIYLVVLAWLFVIYVVINKGFKSLSRVILNLSGRNKK